MISREWRSQRGPAEITPQWYAMLSSRESVNARHCLIRCRWPRRRQPTDQSHPGRESTRISWNRWNRRSQTTRGRFRRRASSRSASCSYLGLCRCRRKPMAPESPFGLTERRSVEPALQRPQKLRKAQDQFDETWPCRSDCQNLDSNSRNYSIGFRYRQSSRKP